MWRRYLLSIGVPQDVTSHNVDDVGFWVDFAHEAAEPPPEPEQRQRKHQMVPNERCFSD